MRTIPFQHTFRHFYLGIVVLIIFILTELTTNNVIVLVRLTVYGRILSLIFLILLLLYIGIEYYNHKWRSNKYAKRYSYDSNGVYGGNVLMMEWSAVKKIDFYKTKVALYLSRSGDGTNQSILYLSKLPDSDKQA